MIGERLYMKIFAGRGFSGEAGRQFAASGRLIGKTPIKIKIEQETDHLTGFFPIKG